MTHTATVTGFMKMDTEDQGANVAAILENAYALAAETREGLKSLDRRFARIFGGVYLIRHDYPGGDDMFDAPRQSWEMRLGHDYPYEHIVAERYDDVLPPSKEELATWVEETLRVRGLRPGVWFMSERGTWFVQVHYL